MAPTSAASVFSSGLFSSSSLSLSRPTTREGSLDSHAAPVLPGSSSASTANPSGSTAKERKSSFSRKASLTNVRRRGTWAANQAANGVVTDANVPPALPDYALAAAAKVAPREKQGEPWSPTSPKEATAAAAFIPPPTEASQGGEAAAIFQQITDLAQKRISTLDYLRRAHEARVYWFNTYLIDRPDFNRMPGFDPRKLARKATNYLLLGLSIPTINDLYSSTPLEFLRCLNSLLSEFESFQQLHGDHTPSASSLTRARLPSMFRRPGAKTRRSPSTTDGGLVDDPSSSTSSSFGGDSAVAPVSAALMSFAAAESDLLPGEEYTYLLTPSLPFDPDFFAVFVTLCDVLIDCYTRFLALVPTAREVSAQMAELFAKADSKMRKIIVQGVVKDFEDHSRTHVRNELMGVGKVVLGGLF